MVKWNDTDVPLGYLITFRTYGTWLAGDERGSIDRYHNIYGTPRVVSNVLREQQHALKLKGEPFLLNGLARRSVREAIREVCEYRKWNLYAVNVRVNHAHAVVDSTASSDKVLGDLKSYATRKLRENKCWQNSYSPWVDKGSKRKLWNEDHIAIAVDYVINGQGDMLPDFD